MKSPVWLYECLIAPPAPSPHLIKLLFVRPCQGVSASAPTTPLLRQHRALSLGFLSSRCSGTLPSDKSKKRRAPLPPMLGSLSYPANLNASTPALSTQEFGKEVGENNFVFLFFFILGSNVFPVLLFLVYVFSHCTV